MSPVPGPPARPGGLRLDGVAVLLAAATTLFHLATMAGYGIFRDELYYLACSRHLDWGFVDHPPLVAVLAWAVRHTLGTSVLALRLLPALAAGGTVLLAVAMARQLGGTRFAQILAGLSVALAPEYLGLLSIYSMNTLDLVVWSVLILLLMKILQGNDPRLWLIFGVIAGVGLQNKLSVLFLGFGVAAGLLAARQWQHLRHRRLWIGAGLAVLIFAPHIAWQVTHGWPTAEFIARATATKNVALSPFAFFTRQILMMNPIAFPLWLTGLGYLLMGKGARPYRTLGWAYLAVLALMMTQNTKPYYLAPIYPPLLAAGAVLLEQVACWRKMDFIRPLALICIGLSGAIIAPLARPLLPVDSFVRYAAALGVEPGTDERKSLGRLPQFFADMHGWQDLAEAVAEVHRQLPPADQERACIFAQNYGQAGAIDHFSPTLGLPAVISGHNSYWLWGPGACDGQVVIIIGGQGEDHARAFTDVTEGGRFHCQDCMPYENDQTLWVARGARATIGEIWPRVKHFD